MTRTKSLVFPGFCGDGSAAGCVCSSGHPREQPEAFGKDEERLLLPGHPSGGGAGRAVPWSCLCCCQALVPPLLGFSGLG